ncbi:MAG: hypothetical protein JNK57_13200, partial [Planctomycetaceae bacterium]|nr:hypothetical protein [Planctomycetaceae bacterium]
MEMKSNHDTVDRRQMLHATGCVAAGCAAGASVMLDGEAWGAHEPAPVRLGFIGVGSRGSTLLRLIAQQAGTEIVAV